ncbi:hypothetical protein [Aeoliella sp.]|uniref:hypothetical protein n=1 Tax=Aeoliella sp. TaxID=2795800 RepID=UPI003CCBD43A
MFPEGNPLDSWGDTLVGPGSGSRVMILPSPIAGPHALRWWFGLLAVLGAPLAVADTVLDEPFDGPQASWELRPAANTRVLAQLRTRSPDVANPRTAERLVISCPAGYAAYATHGIGELRVLDESNIEVLVRGNRQAMQLAAEVVYPRSTDPRTGQPMRALVHGMRYSEPGRWQRLRIEGLPVLAERQARMMSADPKRQVDPREAYIQRVVLVVPGGHGESLVEIDHLKVAGVLTQAPDAAPVAPPLADADGPLLQAPAMASANEVYEPVDIRRHGDTIAVAGQPLVPRVIQYRGEPLELLADLGFNAIWLAEPATEAQLKAARDNKLWVICPPPPAEQLGLIEPNSVWQTVLSWSMGLDRDALDLDTIASQTEEIRRSDRLARPILVGASDRHRRYAQLAEVLVRAQPLGEQGVRTHESLPVMGCSPWTQLSIGWTAAARRQAELLAPKASHLGWHDPGDIHRAALTAMSRGCRGLVVRTPERISTASPEARRLADQLRLLNQEMRLVEPWLVAGKRDPSAELSGSDVAVTAWQLGRSRLVMLPEQPASGPTQLGPATLKLASVPQTARAHMLTPAGLLPLGGGLVAGGYQVEVPAANAGGWVLLTNESRSLAMVQRRLGNAAVKAAQAERGLAMADLLELEAVESQLADARTGVAAGRVTPLKRAIQQCDHLLAAKRYPQTYHLAMQLRYSTAAERRRVQEQLQPAGFISVATAGELRLLPTQQALHQSLASLPRGNNLLLGGDFEDLSETTSAGWSHADYAEKQLDTGVQLVPAQPKHGQSCLRLVARDLGDAAMLDEDPKPVVWITTPDVPVRKGSVVEITGWARVMVTGTDTGELLVVDDLGGEQLGLRIGATTGWQPFRLIRTIDEVSTIRLNLALTGPATADVDAVMIREVLRPQRTAARPAESP